MVINQYSGGSAMTAQRSGPREMLDRMLPLLRDKALGALADLYAEDGVHELPFAPPNAPSRIEGQDNIREYFRSTLNRLPLEFYEFLPVAVHDTSDPAVIVAEFDAVGRTTTTGRQFTVRYLWVLRVEDDAITYWRDYWNPAEIHDLLATA